MPPEPQSLANCSQLRESCQRAIFEKMDKQHSEQMVAMGEIKTEMAYQRGQANGRTLTPTQLAKLKGSPFFQLLAAWGPGLAIVFVLGVVYWLKVNGWL